MKEVFILETDLRGPKKIKINKRFYKKLGAKVLSLKIGDLKSLEDIIRYYENEPLISLRIDLVKKLEDLVGMDKLDLKDPRIRKSLYQFLSYLEKRGLRAMDIKNLRSLGVLNDGLIESIRELRKNSFSKDFLAMAAIGGSKDLAIVLASKNFSTLSMVEPEGLTYDSFLDFKETIGTYIRDFEENKSSMVLGPESIYREPINFKNFPTYARRLILMGLFFLKASVKLREKDLIKEDLSFISRLSFEKSKLSGSDFRQIIPKDEDIFSFIRKSDGRKVLVLLNFSQKEILVDLSFVVMDYKDYEFLLGSYGKRKLYRTIVLRPYEAIAFEKKGPL